MSLSQATKQLEKIRRYISLNAALEKIAGEELSAIPPLNEAELLRITKSALEDFASGCEEIVELERRSLTLTGIVDGIEARDQTVRSKEIDGQAKYLWKTVKNGALAIYYFPFSKEMSSDYMSIAKSYFSVFMSLGQTAKKKKQTLNLRAKMEYDQAKTASKLKEYGMEERGANFLVLNPEYFFYGILDQLKNKYGLDNP